MPSLDTALQTIFEDANPTQKNSLNSKIWLPGKRLNPEVRSKLLELATDFMIEYLVPRVAVTDLIVTGSLANFNWNEASDLDLHIVVNYDRLIPEIDKEARKEMYQIAKAEWSDTHEITIFGHDVEIYVQDVAEVHHSSGVYSLLSNKWIREPQHTDSSAIPTNDEIYLVVAPIIRKIDKLRDRQLAGDDVHGSVEALMDGIKLFRSGGLRGGEYGINNMAFKYLRNHGYLDRLWEMGNESYDKAMSLG